MYPSVAIANRVLTAAVARSQGHEITLICLWMDVDDKAVIAQCKCGWKSEEVRANAHAFRLGSAHLKEQN